MRPALFLLPLVVAAGAPAAAASRPSPAPRPSPAAKELDKVTPEERLAYLGKAAVWSPTEVKSKDLLVGPNGEGAFAFDQEVACDYVVDPTPTGATPKFQCALSPDDIVKVKYGRKNGEAYAEVAGTRLFWALGFGADRMYPVQVTCRNCPIEPWWWSTEKRVEAKTFAIAAIERKLEGKKIESKEDEGWAWEELDLVDEARGGAPRAHRDALKLLMVFIQNSDTKQDNQRMICPPDQLRTDAEGNESCARPLLYVQDLGVSFGEATLLDTSKNDLQDWEGEPIWRDPATCTGNLKKSLTGNLKHPVISEEGRKFLAGLLLQLSDKQITDLFTAARVDRFHRHQERNLPVSEWVRVFKKKRDEIATHRCPEATRATSTSASGKTDEKPLLR